MKNEIEDRKEFYDLLEHVFWAAQGEGCRYEKCVSMTGKTMIFVKDAICIVQILMVVILVLRI